MVKHKHLGVIISSDFRWDSHIIETTNRVQARLWQIRRKLKACLPDTKLVAYRSLIRPVLEYADAVWNLYTSSVINKLEEVQRKVLRLILPPYGHHIHSADLPHRSNTDVLQDRRRKHGLKLLFLLFNDKLRVHKSNYISLFPARHTSFKHEKHLKLFSL